MELGRWLEARAPRICERWSADVTSRGGRWSRESRELLGEFFDLLVDFLPACLGPFRNQAEPLWLQTSELYGSLAARRGLAAGEVVEEFQLLREAVIRLLYAEPPGGGGVSLREILRLNRFVDRGVAQASVGHTDALFFALFQGSGVPENLTPEILGEVREQLGTIRSEFRSVMSLLQP